MTVSCWCLWLLSVALAPYWLSRSAATSAEEQVVEVAEPAPVVVTCPCRLFMSENHSAIAEGIRQHWENSLCQTHVNDSCSHHICIREDFAHFNQEDYRAQQQLNSSTDKDVQPQLSWYTITGCGFDLRALECCSKIAFSLSINVSLSEIVGANVFPGKDRVFFYARRQCRETTACVDSAPYEPTSRGNVDDFLRMLHLSPNSALLRASVPITVMFGAGLFAVYTIF